MKSLIFILAVILISCNPECLLSQVPPQKIYAGSSCTAALPDYRLKISATDNCEIASMTQVPAPGFALTPTNKTATVTVKATDASGNFRQVVFTVTLLDTVKPVFTIDPSLLSYQVEQLKNIYDFGDNIVGQLEKNMNQSFPFDQYPGLREKLADSAFYKQMLVITSFRKSDGNRARLISFADSVKTY